MREERRRSLAKKLSVYLTAENYEIAASAFCGVGSIQKGRISANTDGIPFWPL